MSFLTDNKPFLTLRVLNFPVEGYKSFFILDSTEKKSFQLLIKTNYEMLKNIFLAFKLLNVVSILLINVKMAF